MNPVAEALELIGAFTGTLILAGLTLRLLGILENPKKPRATPCQMETAVSASYSRETVSTRYSAALEVSLVKGGRLVREKRFVRSHGIGCLTEKAGEAEFRDLRNLATAIRLVEAGVSEFILHRETMRVFRHDNILETHGVSSARLPAIAEAA